MTPLELSRDLDRKFWLLLMFAVLAAYGPVILINQPLWDDWVLRAYSDAGTLQELYRQVGARELFWLVKPFASTAPGICTATELFLYVLLGPLIYTIIRETTSWSPPEAFWAALLTAVAPLNQARFVLSTLPYAVSSFFFALTIVLLLLDLKKPSVMRRVSISVFLLAAFTTNSFLVVSWLMPLVVAVHIWRREASLPSYERARLVLWAILKRGELLLLPPLYWLAKKLLEPTYGLYADYNKFQVRPLTALEETVLTLIGQFREVKALLPSGLDVPELMIVAAIAVGVFVLAAWRWKLPLARADGPPRPASRAIDVAAAAIGLALAFCALFPYVAVGKPPRFNGLWETRHQTILLLVSGFAIYAVLRLCLPRLLLSAVAGALTVFFLVIDISVTHRLLLDALETGEISAAMEAHPPSAGTMMLVVEQDRNYRALGRFFAFYELSYMVNPEGREGRALAVSNREILDPATGTYVTGRTPAAESKLVDVCEKFRSLPQYGFGGFVSNGSIEVVRLLPDREPPQLFETIRESIRAAVTTTPAPLPLVRIEHTMSPIGGACRAPCCAGD